MHIKCNKVNLQTYKFLQKSSFTWYCVKCFEDIIPFSTISDHELFQTNKGKNIKFKVLTKKNILTNHDLIDKLNNAMDDPESEMLSSIRNALSQMKWRPYLKTQTNISLSFI